MNQDSLIIRLYVTAIVLGLAGTSLGSVSLYIKHHKIQHLQQEVKDLRVYVGVGCRGHYQDEGEQP